MPRVVLEPEARFSRAIRRRAHELARIGTYVIDLARGTIHVSPEMARLLRVGDVALDLSLQEYRDRFYHPDDRNLFAAADAAYARGEDFHIRSRVVCGDGQSIWVRASSTIETDEHGERVVIGVLQDVTDAKLASWNLDIAREGREGAEQDLRESEQRFREIAESIDEVFWVRDASGERMLYVSPAYERIWQRSPESLHRSAASWLDAVHPDDRERIREASASQARGGYDETYRIERPDGSVRWIRERAYLARAREGEAPRIIGTASDVTDQQDLEARLRHAQKMEAVGVLAGGVAHDFNNILVVIMSYAAMLTQSLDPKDAERAGVHEIQMAAERAAALTRQLLAFSRLQAQQLRTVDLSAALAGTEKMLHRLVGEDVELEILQDAEHACVRIDPSQLEQVVMNLAVNARDAMPGGGKLTIRIGRAEIGESDAAARGLKPGPYVALSVTDTGIGMDASTQQRIFEPFFTTKPLGRGTGLGLSTVLGIVQQSHGQVTVESGVDRGSTFRVWLPITAEAASPASPTTEPRELGGTETILVVEDDEHVRRLAHAILAKHGYSVLEARGGGDALLICERHAGAIDLVLTDVVMPLLGGEETMARLSRVRPNLRVAFMSGYPGKGSTIATTASVFIEKPFTPERLLRGVREALGGAP
jgi:PAS domain S-box-containing protein